MNLLDYHPGLVLFTFFGFISSLWGLGKTFGKLTIGYVDGFIISKKWHFITEANCNLYLKFFHTLYYIFLSLPVICLGVWTITMLYTLRNDSYASILSFLLTGLAAGCTVVGQQLVIWRRYKLTLPCLILFVLSVIFIGIYHSLGNIYYEDHNRFYSISASIIMYNYLAVLILIYLNIGKHFIRFHHILNEHLKDKVTGFTPHPKYKDLIQCLEEDKHNTMYALTRDEFNTFFTITESNTNLDSSSIEAKFGKLKENQQMYVNLIIYGVAVFVLALYSGLSMMTDHKKLGFVLSIAIIAADGMLYILYRTRISTTIGGISMMAMIFRGLLFVLSVDYWYLGFCLIYVIVGVRLVWIKVNQEFPFIERKQFLKIFAPSKEDSEIKPINPSNALYISTGILLGITFIIALLKPDGVPLPTINLYNSKVSFWFMALFAIGFVFWAYLILANIRITIQKRMSNVSKAAKGFMFEGIGEFWMHVTFTYMALIAASIVCYHFAESSVPLIYAIFCPLIVVILCYLGLNYAKNDYELLYSFHVEMRKDKVKQRRKENIEAIKSKLVRGAEVIENARRTNPKRSGGQKAKKRAIPLVRRQLIMEVVDKQESEDSSSEEHMFTSSLNPQAVNAPVFVESDISKMRRKEVGPIGEEVRMFEPRVKRNLKTHTKKPVNWRNQMTFFDAFTKGKLHEQDYKLMGSVAAFAIAVILLMIFIQIASKYTAYPSSWLGLTTAVMIISLAMVVGSCLNILSNGTPMTSRELLLLFAGIGLYVLYGLLFYVIRERMNLSVDFNNYTFPLYVGIYPLLVSIGMSIYNLYMRRKISKPCHILWANSALYLVILAIYLFAGYGRIPGFLFLGLLAIIASSVVIIYAMNRLSLLYDIVIIGGISLISVITILINSHFGLFNSFIVFSFFYLLIAGSTFISSLCDILRAIWNSRVVPVLFSTSVFPSFIYNPTLKQPVSFNESLYTMYISAGTLILWTVILSVKVSPMYYGIIVGGFLMIIVLLITILMSTHSSHVYRECGKYITDDIIKNSWLKAKEDYVKHQSATNIEELQTFNKTYKIKKHFLSLIIKQADGKLEGVELNERESDFIAMSYIKKLIWLSNTDNRTQSLFQVEFSLVILFEMYTLIAAQNLHLKEQHDLINFIRTQNTALRDGGIKINLDGLPSIESKYYSALSQKDKLTKEQQATFEKLWDEYQQKKFQEEEQLKVNERHLQEEMEKKQKMERPCNSVENLNKFMKIVQKYKESGVKYTDPEFPADENSLNDMLSMYIAEWRRATDHPNASIFHGTVSSIDLTQGALGDCYLLSAISVMGEKRVRECFVITEEQAKSGAFLLRLFRGGEFEEYVLIDDLFPIDGDDDWAFARCDILTATDDDYLEMWPMALEKAYAKFYKSYGNIEGGKVHIALAELTGGIPQYIKITDYEVENADKFHKQLQIYHDNGYMLGAGTPENVRGDRAVNENGIVQGHAYAILDVQSYGGEKLIQLRNPHGSRGIEWNGDWSDESYLWSPAAIKELKHEEIEDGIFWMSINDFVDEFKYVYICRKFDGRWTVTTLEDSCEGEFTLQDDGLEKFPQYEVTVTKPTTVFIKVLQSETLSSFQGKFPIFAMMLENEGKKAFMSDTQKIVCSSLPPINYVSVTTEILVDMYYTLPYIFTAVAGVMRSQSKFTIKFYSTDPKFTVRKIN